MDHTIVVDFNVVSFLLQNGKPMSTPSEEQAMFESVANLTGHRSSKHRNPESRCASEGLPIDRYPSGTSKIH